MRDCCGLCKFHEKKPVEQVGFVNGQEVRTLTGWSYGGDFGHPNGQCTETASKWAGIVTGWQGHCERFSAAKNLAAAAE